MISCLHGWMISATQLEDVIRCSAFSWLAERLWGTFRMLAPFCELTASSKDMLLFCNSWKRWAWKTEGSLETAQSTTLQGFSWLHSSDNFKREQGSLSKMSCCKACSLSSRPQPLVAKQKKGKIVPGSPLVLIVRSLPRECLILKHFIKSYSEFLLTQHCKAISSTVLHHRHLSITPLVQPFRAFPMKAWIGILCTAVPNH